MCNKNPKWAKYNKSRWSQLKFNTEFLKKMELEYGELRCEYCGKPNLKVYEWCHKSDISDMATADHFYPKSKYDSIKQDGRNIVVSCHDCNNKKQDDLWSVDMIKFPLKKTKYEEINQLYEYLLA